MIHLPRTSIVVLAAGLSALSCAPLCAQQRIEPLGAWTLGAVTFSAPNSWQVPSVDNATPPLLDLAGADWVFAISDRPARPDIGATLVLWWSNDVDASGKHAVVNARRPAELAGLPALRVDWAEPSMGWRGIDLVLASPPLAGKTFSFSCRSPSGRWSATAPICEEIAAGLQFQTAPPDTGPVTPPETDSSATNGAAPPVADGNAVATPTVPDVPTPVSPPVTPPTPPSPPTTAPAPPTAAPASPWTLVAAVIGTIAVLAALALGIGIMRRRRMASSVSSQTPLEPPSAPAPATTPAPPPPPPPAPAPAPPPPPPPRPARFCTECGAPIPSGPTCPRCGATDPSG